ncbi:MAG: TolC family protein [Gammaproteobacteria bacterium]|nr:TolC family protein [Gammaproteobacteria bacterium]
MATSHRLAVFILTAAATMHSSASPLQELYQLAQSNDPSYLAAQHTLNAQLQIIPQAKSALMPQVSASANQNIALDSRADNHNYSAQIALPLRLDAYYGMKVAEQSASNARIVFEKSQQSLILLVVERYVAVLKQQHNLTSSMAEVAAIEQRLKQTQQLVKLGLNSQIELQDIQASVQQLHVSLLQVQQNLSLARGDLENLTNQTLPNQLPALASSFNPSLVPSDTLENWLVLTKNNNLDIASNTFTAQQAYHNYQAKDVGLYPKASITLSQSYSSITGDNKTLAIGLSGTFYDGGLNSAQTKEAKEAWYAAQQQGQALLKTTQQQVRRLYQTQHTGTAQIKALSALHTAVEASLVGKNKEYELGLRDVSDILDAQKLVFAAQRNLANARLDLVLNQVRLKQASGLLSVDDLSQLDQWFN